LLGLFFRPWRLRRYVPPKRRLTFNGLHDVISQKVVLFITTAVRTSNPTWKCPNYGPNEVLWIKRLFSVCRIGLLLLFKGLLHGLFNAATNSDNTASIGW
jgi:hypothetical protein